MSLAAVEPIVRRVLLVAGLALLGIETLVLRAAALDLFGVPTPSMVPSLIPGDVYVADLTPGTPRPPQPGEIVLFRPPRAGAPGLYIKRVVATAGSSVAVVAGRLVVDGIDRSFDPPGSAAQLHDEELGGLRYRVEVDRGRLPLDYGPVRVPAGHVFVLGDSRARSVDSRSFGPVPVASIRGRALRVLWSRDRAHQLRWRRWLVPLTAPHSDR